MVWELGLRHLGGAAAQPMSPVPFATSSRGFLQRSSTQTPSQHHLE